MVLQLREPFALNNVAAQKRKKSAKNDECVNPRSMRSQRRSAEGESPAYVALLPSKSTCVQSAYPYSKPT